MPHQTPARLSFLAIFNPTLGRTDETIDDQVLYYASLHTLSSRRGRQKSRGAGSGGRPAAKVSQEERNERLRQIGFAQGMVEFAKGFSAGQSVNSVETEKGRVVLEELEENWWILAVGIDSSLLPIASTADCLPD